MVTIGQLNSPEVALSSKKVEQEHVSPYALSSIKVMEKA